MVLYLVWSMFSCSPNGMRRCSLCEVSDTGGLNSGHAAQADDVCRLLVMCRASKSLWSGGGRASTGTTTAAGMRVCRSTTHRTVQAVLLQDTNSHSKSPQSALLLDQTQHLKARLHGLAAIGAQGTLDAMRVALAARWRVGLQHRCQAPAGKRPAQHVGAM